MNKIMGRAQETFSPYLHNFYHLFLPLHCELFKMGVQWIVSGLLKEIRFSTKATCSIPHAFNDVFIRVLFVRLIILSGGSRLDQELPRIVFRRVKGVGRGGRAQFGETLQGVEAWKGIGEGLFWMGVGVWGMVFCFLFAQ